MDANEKWTYSVVKDDRGTGWYNVSLDGSPWPELHRDWDGNRVYGDRDDMQVIADHLNHGPLVLEVHICDQRRSYTVTWEGTDEEIDTRATEWLRARGMTHSFHDVEGFPINYTRFPKFTEWKYPQCYHGLSADLCYGPGHYDPTM